MSALNDNELENLANAAHAALGQEWHVIATPPSWTREDALGYALRCLETGFEDALWMVGYGGKVNEEGYLENFQFVSMTGMNGESSKAFAYYIKLLQPATMLLLLEELRAARAATPWAEVMDAKSNL